MNKNAENLERGRSGSQGVLESSEDPSVASVEVAARPAASGSLRRLAHRSTAPTSIVAGLVLWEIAVRLFRPSELVLVAPSQISVRVWEMFSSGSIWPDFTISMQSFVLGYGLSALIAIPVGLAIGASAVLYRWTSPWISALYATPIIGLAPLFVITFGFGITAKVAVVFALVVFPILINSVAGARAVSLDHREVGIVFRANRLEMFRCVLLPGSLPFILAGLRLAVGRGLIGVVVADLFGASAGLGHNLQRSALAFDTASIFAVTVVLAFLGVALTAILEAMERRANRGVT